MFFPFWISILLENLQHGITMYLGTNGKFCLKKINKHFITISINIQKWLG